ncbi:MAG: bifunctional folylpolyglutamate synthase/dihydrofolate synthase [Clostridiales bacterium]|nr:bifunctional folylpolyglutamate synthase/dihydrofolate synthase [Clostridiales bacterium]
MWTRHKNTLEQVRAFLDEMGDPERGLRLVHVAGTNGKGSVCADMTAILTAAGYRVGTFISPHLVDVKERFLLDGEPVSEELFADGFEQVLAVTRRLTGQGFCHPTYFEFLFLMAMAIYAEVRPDFVILETGLGGRLDTTNVIRAPLASVITAISLDHTAYLGDTIAAIAAEKAGIIKAGVPVIYDDNQQEASAVIHERAVALGSPVYPVSEAAVRELGLDVVPFAAPYQAMNAALAVRALQVMRATGTERTTGREMRDRPEPGSSFAVRGVDLSLCYRALSTVRWPGRMEEVRPGVWLDGAHNPGGIAAFIRAVKAMKAPTGEIQLLFAAVADKDYRQMIALLCEELPLGRVTVAQMESERALGAAALADQFVLSGCRSAQGFSDTCAALTDALAHKGPEDRLYVVGSLYLIGEVKALLT